MRESIGATWIMVITMFFMILFAGFLAFSINYSKAFRVKDGVIERIRKFNGLKDSTLNDINDFLNEIGYKSQGDCYKYYSSEFDDSPDADVLGVTGNGADMPEPGRNFDYCIIRVTAPKSGTNVNTSVFYRVVVFFSLRIGNYNIGSTFRVTGETSQIYYAKEEPGLAKLWLNHEKYEKLQEERRKALEDSD